MISILNRRTALVLLTFVVLGFLTYSNTFDSSFHFDDAHVVSDLSFEDMLNKCKVGGSRVICHLTFLLNYRLGGTNVFGYHVFNTLIHIGTACFVYMFLFQILSVSNHRSPSSTPTLPSPLPARASQWQAGLKGEGLSGADRILPPFSDPVFWPAFIGGLLFLVHPLATQAVTYITQRYTSLAGFFYIGSLSFFVSARIKSHEGERFLSGSHLLRYVCSLTMAVLAMRTKEMAITLPAAILLTEFSFIQSDFREATKRILYLLPLLSTGLIIPISNIIGVETINLETIAALGDYTWAPQITRIEYLLTQFKVIVGIYLKLLVWPIGQNIDHDFVVSKTFFDLPTMASFLALCLILGIGLWLFKRARLVSFGILWFFVTISPTSSIVPNTEFVAEHRVYISLMGLAFAVAGLPAWQTHRKRYILVLLTVLLLLSGLTYARNIVWQTDLTLWKDSVAKSPKRARPRNNLGNALAKDGKLKEAINHYSEAIKIEPDYAEVHNNFGNVLVMQGNLKEAVGHYYKALDIKPNFANPYNNLGVALARMGRLKEAVNHYSEAIRIEPNFVEAHINLGLALVKQKNFKGAIAHYSEALHINPGNADAHYNMGIALAQMSKHNEAISHYSQAIQFNSDDAEAHYNMGVSLAQLGRLNEAINHYSVSLRIKPDYAEAQNNLAVALTSQGKIKEAISHYSEALRIKPSYADAHCNMGLTLAQVGRFNEAISHYSQAIQIRPEFPEAHNNMGLALANQGRLKEAISHFSMAVQIKPEYTDAHNNLGAALVKLGRLNEAISHFSMALKIKPDHTDARRNLEIVLRQMGKSAGESNTVVRP